MYAKVIVDVPAKQTNRAFDYTVPPELEQWVDIGSRVGVPFGPRMIQGFVVELHETTDIDTAKIKAIDKVLDIHAPLTEELIQLAGWMSKKYLCHEITALQSMIPGALKAKYERSVTLAETNLVTESDVFEPRRGEVIRFVSQKGSVALETLLGRFPAEQAIIKEMINAGALVEEQHIKDRVSKKKLLTVYPPEEAQLRGYMEQCTGQRQRDVLNFLCANPAPITLSELTAALNVSSGTVKSLADKGWILLQEADVFRDPYASRTFAPSDPLSLTKEQDDAYRQICGVMQSRTHQVFLLHGVTGSGKTEVYLQAIQQCLELGREAIVLVPEIALTPQMVERFKSRFGDLVAVLHSRLSDGERYDEWRKIQLRKVKVAIGARSAVFAPFTDLGLIVIDEEHEASYKQEDSPKYQAKEIAVFRARHHQASVVLGSATPSLESFYYTNAFGDPRSASPVRLLSISSRVEGRPLPKVQIVDMREQLREGNRSIFSSPLHKAIQERLDRREQMVLLLNRRGHSTFVMCRSCGYVAGCPHCDISLTYHQHSRTVRCHYCGYAERSKTVCPDCGSEHIRYFGTGTQRVEEELGKLFPGIRVIRMDMDTTSEKGSHEKWLNMFRDRQADVLLGTQMVAKGLDFPHVTLVGVIAADTVLNLPDFRSAEKTFQLMTQVAGRAGRHELPGEVVVQTYTPDHYSIRCASHHDYTSFVQLELAQRRERNYPPYCKLILITLSHEQVTLLVKVGEALVRYLKEQWNSRYKAVYANSPKGARYSMEVLGPVASPIPRIKDRYRFQCMVKYRGDMGAADLVSKAVSSMEDMMRQEKLQISVDVDPQMLM
jgi:primosomal protein N' (replication factor Y)